MHCMSISRSVFGRRVGEQMKIYVDSSTVTDSNIKNLSPLFSFHWSGLDASNICSGKQNPDSRIVISHDIARSDWAALPMHWTYYLWNKKAKMPEADAIAKLASDNGKGLIVWFRGDLVPIVPYANAEVFLPGMIRSRSTPRQHACPVFINDPRPVWGSNKETIRHKGERPVVGFCGYGSLSKIKLLWSMYKGVLLNSQRVLRQTNYAAIPILPATILRNRAISNLTKNPKVETRFVIHGRHTKTNSPSEALASTAAEVFFSNIYDTDYTLCVRGYGNWSYRFYETLACGRIPIFVDTDCVLPLQTKIDWKKYSVWVDRSELHLIAEKLLDFHASLSPADFVELQVECRKLWEENFTPRGFSENLPRYLEGASATCQRANLMDPTTSLG